GHRAPKHAFRRLASRAAASEGAPSPQFVIAGHSASEDARERAYDPAIHPSSQRLLAKTMDARVKPAHDDSPARRAGGHGGMRTNVIGSTSARERQGTLSHAPAPGISDALAHRARPPARGGA